MKLLLLAIRSLTRYRLYTVINVLGLSLSLASVAIISRYVYNEYTTDHGFKEYEHVFLSARQQDEQTKALQLFTTDNVLLKGDYTNPLSLPETEKYTSFVSLSNVVIQVDDKHYSTHVFATDSNFLAVFPFPYTAEGSGGFLAEPNNAVISRSFSNKVFGKDNPVGKTIQYNEHILVISGITDDLQTQCSFSFDLLISQELQWRWPPVNYYSAVRLVPGTSLQRVNEKLLAEAENPDKAMFTFQILPLDKLYFNTAIDKGEGTFTEGSSSNLRVLLLIAFLILLIGTINFIQICSVIILKRNREMGMKKIFGARPGQLFIQLFVENLILTAIALFIGWVLVELTQGIQENILHIQILNNPSFNRILSVSILLGIPLFTTIYPFYRYTYQQPIVTIKDMGESKRRIGLRSFFLIAQYGITCCLIISAFFFMKQLHDMLHTDPGYQTNNIIKAWFIRPSSAMMMEEEKQAEISAQLRFIRESVNASPLFITCCYGKSPNELINDPFAKRKIRTPGGEWKEVYFVNVDKGFFDLFQISLPDHGSILSENDVLLNETARRLFASKEGDPKEIEVESYKIFSYQVKDFLPDFQMVHLSQHNVPLVINYFEEDHIVFYPEKLMASISPGRRQEAIAFLQKLHEETVGGEFEYSFVEEEINKIYEKDHRVSNVYFVFALIAILLSTMGLFSLSLFDIQQRYKEIAIRKVNGATTPVIMRLFLNYYLKLIMIAFIIATPISWLAITKYMEDFAYRTSLSWWIFALALLITGSISLLTLIWQIRKAAGSNLTEAINK